MKDHDRQHESLDDAERALQQRLRALPGGEPPPALDRRILQAAQDAVASARPRRTRWLLAGGSAWSIGSAAAAVLGIGLGIQFLQQQYAPLRVDAPTAAVMQAPKSEERRLSIEFIERTPREIPQTAPPPPPPPAAPVVGELRAQRAEADRVGNDMAGAGREPEPTVEVLPPPPDAFLDEHVDLQRARQAVPAMAAPAPAAAQESTAASLAAKQHAADRVSAADPGFDSRDIARVRNDQKLAFKSWLTRIHRRIDEGDLSGARASLALLRERHPQQRIPVELLDRLRE